MTSRRDPTRGPHLTYDLDVLTTANHPAHRPWKFYPGVVQVQQYRIPREDTKQWARNLRFLTGPESISMNERRNCACDHLPYLTQPQCMRMVQLADCEHYVAVSWCWQAFTDQGGQSILGPDGRYRSIKGSSILLARAVNYATAHGFPLV